jgi:hypothetical protein
MMTKFSDDIWVIQTLRLVQALLGAVSENFRMVCLSHDGASWRLIFVLHEDNAEDREEIADVACEFEALQDSPTEYLVEVIVTSQQLEWPVAPVRVVYRRREN